MKAKQSTILGAPVDPAAGLITKKELSVHVRKSPRTINGWMKLRKIPYIKLGDGPKADVLFDLVEVKAALKQKFGVNGS